MDGIGNLYPVLQTVQKSSHRGKIHHHSHIKVVMGILMFVFAMFELLPVLRDLRVDRKYLFWGGQWPLILSGIFAAFTGLMIGKRWMHKVTMKTV
jgi:uncharacterized integral membrane protein